MNREQQAYINGFVKRANEHGYNEQEALAILKQAEGFFSGMGNKIDSGITNTTQAVGNKINQATGYVKGLGNSALEGTKQLATRAQHAITDPVVKQYHRSVDPYVAGFEAFKNKANEPYRQGPGEYDFIGPQVPKPAPVAPAPTSVPMNIQTAGRPTTYV